MAKELNSAPLDIVDWLREHGLRATLGRIAIVKLLDRSKTPLTLANIHDKLRKEGCDFATVFRFVTILEKKGLVERVPWLDGSVRHEIRLNQHQAHHHYLICRSCRKVEPIHNCVVERIENQITKERGYTSLSHSLQLSGVCPSCQKSRKGSRKKKS